MLINLLSLVFSLSIQGTLRNPIRMKNFRVIRRERLMRTG